MHNGFRTVGYGYNTELHGLRCLKDGQLGFKYRCFRLLMVIAEWPQFNVGFAKSFQEATVNRRCTKVLIRLRTVKYDYCSMPIKLRTAMKRYGSNININRAIVEIIYILSSEWVLS